MVRVRDFSVESVADVSVDGEDVPVSCHVEGLGNAEQPGLWVGCDVLVYPRVVWSSEGYAKRLVLRRRNDACDSDAFAYDDFVFADVSGYRRPITR